MAMTEYKHSVDLLKPEFSFTSNTDNFNSSTVKWDEQTYLSTAVKSIKNGRFVIKWTEI